MSARVIPHRESSPNSRKYNNCFSKSITLVLEITLKILSAEQNALYAEPHIWKPRESKEEYYWMAKTC